jgi:hypothetical protein
LLKTSDWDNVSPKTEIQKWEQKGADVVMEEEMNRNETRI